MGALYSVEASGQDFVIRRLLSGAGSTSLTSTLVATIDLPGQLLRTGRTIPAKPPLPTPEAPPIAPCASIATSAKPSPHGRFMSALAPPSPSPHFLQLAYRCLPSPALGQPGHPQA